MPKNIINDLPSITHILKNSNLYAKKKLSQNFILDLNITNKIVNLSEGIKNNNVIEIGPGPGSLTRSILLNEANKVIVIEKDERFIEILNNLKTVSDNRLFILNEDALKININDILNKYDIKSAEIISNLPYSIGTKLLLKWIPVPKNINQMTLMFQKEVAERIVARPGSKKYGRLSIVVGLMAEVKIIMHLPAKAFSPKPKVDSCIVKVKPLLNKKFLFKKHILEEITKILFNQRRKQIKSTLVKFGEPVKLCKLIGVKPCLRPEQVTLEQYEKLAIFLSKDLYL